MEVRRISARKVVFQFHLSWKVHWLRRTEVPANYSRRAFTGNVQGFFFFSFFKISKTLIQSPQTPSWVHSIPTDNMLHAPSYKVNTMYVNAGSKRRTAAGTRRPNPIQWPELGVPSHPQFPAVADSLQQFCPMLCLFVIIFQKKGSQRTFPWWKSWAGKICLQIHTFALFAALPFHLPSFPPSF